MAKWLIGRGHQVRVLLHQGMNYGITELYTYEGVEVFPVTRRLNNNLELELFSWCTHAITHLEYTGFTIEMAKMKKKPCIQVVHNDTPYEVVLAAAQFRPINIIYNSQWIADKLRYSHNSIVLTPPVDYRYYDQGIAEPYDNIFITIINANNNKGGRQATMIARAMPDRMFLFVKGSYEKQFIPYSLPNVRVVENTSDIRPIYKMTRIVIMPSEYESWGMVATEAMANGIPVICTATPGLMENTAGKMLYCDRRDIPGWIKKIQSLDHRPYYNRFRNAGRERAKELDPLAGYEKLEQFLYEAV